MFYRIKSTFLSTDHSFFDLNPFTSPTSSLKFMWTNPTLLKYLGVHIVVVQSLSHVQHFETRWTAAWQPSLYITVSQGLPNSCHWVHDATPSSLPLLPFFSCPQSFPASGSFPMSWHFTSGGQCIGASAPILSMNSQCLFPLDWVMSLLFNMLSRFVIIFLPRSKCLGDFGVQVNKICHCFHFFPQSICHD